MIYYDMPFKEYRELPGINASLLKNYAEGKSPLNNTVKFSSKSMSSGTIFHSIAENRGVLNNHDLAFSPFKDFRTKDAQNWKKEQLELGRTIVTEDESAVILEAWRNVQFKARQLDICIEGKPEVTIRTDNPYYKCRIDELTDDYIIDWKTCKDADIRSIRRDIDKYGYLIQAAHYQRCVEMELGEARPFLFVFTEVTPPFNCTFVTISDEAMLVGYTKLDKALERMNEPGSDAESYHKGIYEYEPNSWDLEQVEEVAMEDF
jgi:hypothetical protein